jgi:hypothetical protein
MRKVPGGDGMNLKLKRSRSTAEHEARKYLFKTGCPSLLSDLRVFRHLRDEKRRNFMSRLTSRLVSIVAGYMCTIALAGCGATTVTPTFPAATGLPQTRSRFGIRLCSDSCRSRD